MEKNEKINEIKEEKLEEVNGGSYNPSHNKKKRRSFSVGEYTFYKYKGKEVNIKILSSYSKEKTFLFIGLNEYETWYHVQIVNTSTEFDVSESDLSDYYYKY